MSNKPTPRHPEFISGSIFSIMDPDLRQDDSMVIVCGDNPTTVNL
ncbi:hypothetical protein [Pseudoalteromonas phenolica]|nr:hypothetical protein [Pseudoalteromonas phenolica]